MEDEKNLLVLVSRSEYDQDNHNTCTMKIVMETDNTKQVNRTCLPAVWK